MFRFSRVDFLQQLMDVTGLKDYNFRRFQTEYCMYTKHGLKIEQNRNRDFSFKIESKLIIWLKSHIVTALQHTTVLHH